VGKWKLKLPRKVGPKAPKGVEGNPLMLIDLEADVGEKNNLADKHPEVVKRLKARMEAFQKGLGKLPRPKT
jgi:hypothetical protein